MDYYRAQFTNLKKLTSVKVLKGTNFIEFIIFLRFGVLLSSRDQMYRPIMQSTEDSAICFFQTFSGLEIVILTRVFLVLEWSLKLYLGLSFQEKLESFIVSNSLSYKWQPPALSFVHWPVRTAFLLSSSLLISHSFEL